MSFTRSFLFKKFHLICLVYPIEQFKMRYNFMLLMIVYLNVSTNAFSFESLSEEKRTGFKGSRRLCGRRLIEVMKQTCAQGCLFKMNKILKFLISGTTLPCFRAVDNSYSIVSNVKRFVPVNRRDDDYSTNYIRHHKNHHHKHKVC